jgi:exopolyphosphatase/guanosine-5'-triphosphate,3'-diphosphate pyrophosphatase
MNQGEPQVLAAVDLGSNSFHMVVGRYSHGDIVILDRIREMVRLGAGLNAEGVISEEAADRALACLARFRERLTAMRAGSVRAVGTNTLRRARRKQNFLVRAEHALGHPIEVISGIEEARLVYLGAAHSLPASPGRRLVVDIGGGSTEIVVGDGLQAGLRESLYMGCVSISLAHFPDGAVTKKGFEQARLAALRELDPVVSRFRDAGWEVAVGTSGTMRATGRIAEHLTGEPGIGIAGIEAIRQRMLDVGGAASSDLPGLSQQRAPVYPGGLAIVAAVFESLGIEQMAVSDGALREGLLYDLVGRLTDEDARDRAVRAFQERFHVDLAQALRVETTARHLAASVEGVWEVGDEESTDLLAWSARLHEVGLDIAHSHHQRHAAYLVGHADLSGFSADEQARLALLVGAHRRKIDSRLFKKLEAPWKARLPRLLALLRLGVLLHRSRSPQPLPPLRLKAGPHKIKLRFPPGWLELHPLTAADLKQERSWLKALDLQLDYK